MGKCKVVCRVGGLVLPLPTLAFGSNVCSLREQCLAENGLNPRSQPISFKNPSCVLDEGHRCSPCLLSQPDRHLPAHRDSVQRGCGKNWRNGAPDQGGRLPTYCGLCLLPIACTHCGCSWRHLCSCQRPAGPGLRSPTAVQ